MSFLKMKMPLNSNSNIRTNIRIFQTEFFCPNIRFSECEYSSVENTAATLLLQREEEGAAELFQPLLFSSLIVVAYDGWQLVEVPGATERCSYFSPKTSRYSITERIHFIFQKKIWSLWFIYARPIASSEVAVV